MLIFVNSVERLNSLVYAVSPCITDCCSLVHVLIRLMEMLLGLLFNCYFCDCYF